MLRIIWQTIQNKRTSLIVYCLGMAGFMFMYIAIYPTILEQADQLEELMAAYPQAFLQAFGIENFSFNTIEKFLAVEYYSAIWPLAMITLLVSTTSGAIAGEIEQGTAELLLAKPVSRAKIFMGKYLGAMAMVVLFNGVTVFSVFPAAWAFNIEVDANAQFMILVLTLLFALATMSLGFLSSSLFSERSRASLLTGSVLITMYVVNLVASLVSDLEWLQYTSLFHYFDHESALLDVSLSWPNALAMIGFAAISTVAAYRVFVARDISN